MAAELDTYKLTVKKTASGRALATTRSILENELIGVATCKIFSSAEAVQGFLNKEGYAALHDGVKVKVVGLAGPPGAKTEVYAVLVGAMRLLTDYRNVRKFPNCELRARPACGPNDGFLELIARTHNGCGIGALSDLTPDLGEDYVKGAVPGTTPAKKIKGALDNWIEKNTRLDPVFGVSDGEDGEGKEGDDKEKDDKGKKDKKAEKEKKEKEDDKDQKAEKDKKAEKEKKAEKPKDDEKDKKAQDALVAKPDKKQQDGQEGELINSSSDFVMTLSQTKGLLIGVPASSVGNKKVPKHQVLKCYNTGDVKESRDAGFLWSFKKPSDEVFLKRADGSFKATTLAHLAETYNANSIHRHNTWSGRMPKILVAKVTAIFVPSTDKDGFEQVFRAVKTSQKGGLAWAVEVKDKKVIPYGVLLISKASELHPVPAHPAQARPALAPARASAPAQALAPARPAPT